MITIIIHGIPADITQTPLGILEENIKCGLIEISQNVAIFFPADKLSRRQEDISIIIHKGKEVENAITVKNEVEDIVSDITQRFFLKKSVHVYFGG